MAFSDSGMSRRDLRYSPVRLELQRRIPRGTAWLFHWAATDGDAIPVDREHRPLHRGEEPIGVAITKHYRDRIIEETGITERWWNEAVAKWIRAGIACRCVGYKSVFLFIFAEPACARCGLLTGTESSQGREVRVPVVGSGSSQIERESQSASSRVREQGALTAVEVQRLKEKFGSGSGPTRSPRSNESEGEVAG
jgi:hypothetical protein